MTKRVGKKVRAPDPCELIMEIDRYEQAYYISEHGPDGRAASDEALIDVQGRIVAISRKLKQHLNEPIEASFACATSYAENERTPVSDKPFLLPVNFRKDRCGFMTYLPAAAFWSIPGMIDAGRLTHIEARFHPPRYGSGALIGVYLVPAAKLTGLLQEGTDLTVLDDLKQRLTRE